MAVDEIDASLTALNETTVDGDETAPPVAALRYSTPAELYAAIPKLAHLTLHSPFEGEDAFSYLMRLAGSSTPEDAITYAAFAAKPNISIWWGLECIRHIYTIESAEVRSLLSEIAHWTNTPSDTARWSIMRQALYAPRRDPSIFLGLAVGWSGGSVAPNDPMVVPPWRAPQAIDAAVRAALSESSGQRRWEFMGRVIDLAGPQMRAHSGPI